MGKFEVKLNLQGINELMKSAEMQSALHSAAQSVAGAANGDYETAGYVLNWVALENVYPASPEAARDNFKNNTLVKALGSVGLSMKK